MTFNAIRIMPAMKQVLPIELPFGIVDWRKIKELIGDKSLAHFILTTADSPVGGLDVWVDDEGLLVKDNDYWTFRRPGSAPYAGLGLVTSFDEMGNTKTLTKKQFDFILPKLRSDIRFIGNRAELAKAFQKGTVQRPVTTMNGEVLWSMPDEAE